MKRGDHNTGVSDGTKKFFNGKKKYLIKKIYPIKNLVKNLKKYLIKNLKKLCLIKEPIKNIKRVLYQKKYSIKNLIKSLKKYLLKKLKKSLIIRLYQKSNKASYEKKYLIKKL